MKQKKYERFLKRWFNCTEDDIDNAFDSMFENMDDNELEIMLGVSIRHISNNFHNICINDITIDIEKRHDIEERLVKTYVVLWFIRNSDKVIFRLL